MRRPAESPGGFAKTDPGVAATRLMLPAPAHDLGDRPPPRITVAGTQPEFGPDHQVAGLERRAAVAEAERGGVPVSPALPGEVQPAVPQQRGGDVGTVATGVHSESAPHGPRHAHRPFETGQAGLDRAPGQMREGQCASHAHAHEVAAPVRVDLEGLEAAGRTHDQTRESGIGDEHVRAPAEDEHRQGMKADGRDGSPRPRPRHGLRPATPPSHRRGTSSTHRAADPGGPDLQARPRPARWPLPRRAQHRCPATISYHEDRAINSSARVVRSPAPSVQQRSPLRSIPATTCRSSSRPGT